MRLNMLLLLLLGNAASCWPQSLWTYITSGPLHQPMLVQLLLLVVVLLL
jgi:hypothetical protein